MTQDHFDVLIIGAGLSGIGAAYHLQKKCPGKSYAILEGRDAIGGTWDLFRYPGIRSDSDMFTLGYNFRPWVNKKAIADDNNDPIWAGPLAAKHPQSPRKRRRCRSYFRVPSKTACVPLRPNTTAS